MKIIKKYIGYLKDNPKGYWFKRKLYGWGWTPATWQGWAVTLFYIILVLLLALTIDKSSPDTQVMPTFVPPIVLLTVVFICIAYKKGETPRWQWGHPKDQ
jgi:hypothetical protein